MFPFPICPLAGQSMSGQNSLCGFIGFSRGSGSPKILPINRVFYKVHAPPRLTDVLPFIQQYEAGQGD
jgi:hypothetical protein